MSIPWGVDMGVGVTAKDLDNFEALVGKKVGLVGFGTWWWNGSTYNPFPQNKTDLVNSRGGVTLWNWIPGLSNGNTPSFSNSTVLAGTHDAYIDRIADTIKALPYEVWVRILHEMNGSWYQTWWEGSSYNAGLGSGQYIATFRHVVDRVRARGCTNVKWVWCPNIQGKDPRFSIYQPYSQLYPGDDYVDIKAFDGYNFGRGSWFSMQQVFEGGAGSWYQDSLANIVGVGSVSKPVLIAETGCNVYDENGVVNGPKKAAWFTEALTSYLPNQPQIGGFIYSNYIDSNNDWRIDYPLGGPQLAAFAAGIASSYYSGTVVTGGGGVTNTGPAAIIELPQTTYARHEAYGGMDSAGRLYVHGDVGTEGVPIGEDPIYDFHSEPERYDSTTKTWTVLDNPPRKLYQFAAILDDQDRYIGCGSEILCYSSTLSPITATQGGAPPDTWVYDPSTGTWNGAANSINGPTGTPCTSTGVAGGGGGLFFKFNGQFYCGQGSASNGVLQRYTGGMSGVWVGDTDLTGLITSLSDEPINPYSFSYAQPITSDGRVIYTGAIPSSNPSRSNRILFYAPASASITYSALAPYQVRNGSWDGSRFLYYWAFTGSGISGSYLLVQYDTLLDAWATFTGPFPGAGSSIQAGVLIATPTAVYMLGYKQTPGPPPSGFVGDIYSFDLASSTWTNLSPLAIPINLGSYPFPSLPQPGAFVKDTIGNGFYLVGWGGAVWDNHVFYFTPSSVLGDPGTDLHEPPLIQSIGRAWGQIIG